jgi:hypothetical protein
MKMRRGSWVGDGVGGRGVGVGLAVPVEVGEGEGVGVEGKGVGVSILATGVAGPGSGACSETIDARVITVTRAKLMMMGITLWFTGFSSSVVNDIHLDC